MAKAKVLIVEDDGIIAMDLESRLKSFGYSVPGIVSYGEDAIKKVEECRPDLVFMDIVLKGDMDGIEAAKQIRIQFNIPVVFVTAHMDEDRLERAKLTLPFGYILKPFLDRELKATIEIALYTSKIDAERKQSAEALRESEEKYRQLFATVSDAIMVFDAETKEFIDANNAVSELYGYSNEEFLGLKHTDITAEPEESIESIKKVVSGETIKIPLRYHKHKDGTIFPVEISSGIFKLGNRQLVCEVVRDISERKRAENELLEKSQLNQMLLDALPCVALLLRPKTREIVASNEAGRKAGALPGKTCYGTWGQRNDPCPWCLAPQVWATGKLQYLEVDALDIVWEAHWHPIDEDLYLHYAFDITEQRKMAAQLQQAQKMEAIGTLAGGIAHDFNNILFPIVGYAEMMLDDFPEDSPHRNDTNEILQGAKRAGDLVKQILTFSRQSDQKPKPFKVQLIIKEVLKLIRSSLPSTIEIKQYISNKCGLVMADPAQIHQIAMNLITNAFQAMEDEGGVLEVILKEIELGLDDLTDPSMTPGTYVCLTVTDTGPGMDQSVISRIFEPYFTTKENGKGTGLGLAVVHGIVKSYKGDIRVYSEPEAGTAFHVYLPAIKSQVETEETDTVAPVPKGTERILLVDDEDTIVRMEKQMLERLGYQVTARTSSIEALEAFRASPNKFDLVITDMTMPNMTGVQLSQKLLEIQPDIPIIICTGFSTKIDDEKAKAFGIRGYVMKPVVMSEIAKKIRGVLDHE